MEKVFLYFVLALCGIASGPQKHVEEKSIPLPNGAIPDDRTAVKVAEAMLIPIYGEEQIAKEQPFKAELRGDTWVVSGTANNVLFGGIATVELSKSKGCVQKITHGK